VLPASIVAKLPTCHANPTKPLQEGGSFTWFCKRLFRGLRVPLMIHWGEIDLFRNIFEAILWKFYKLQIVLTLLNS
jgi:hypothetical protein